MTALRNVQIWKLAPDRNAYGKHAGWYLLVSEDGEDELAGPFRYEDEAEFHAAENGWIITADERS